MDRRYHIIFFIRISFELQLGLKRHIRGQKPSHSRIIIMGPDINNTVLRKIKWQVGIFHVPVKCKQQDLHPRILEFVTQFFNSRSDDPEVFSNDGQSAKPFFHPSEKRGPRPLFPDAVLGGFVSVRNAPIGFKSAKMINSDEVNQ